MNHPTPTAVEPCRHPSYITNFTGLPPGTARCFNVRCGQVFLRLDRTQVCEDAAYTSDELAAGRLHDRCSGYVLSPDSRCQCLCHGTRLVAPARPADVYQSIDGTETTIHEWRVGTAGTVTAADAVRVHTNGGVALVVTTVEHVDQLMAALAGARLQLTQGGTR